MKTLPPCDHDECPPTRCIHNADAKGVGISDGLGARPNVALALSYPEWTERYRRALLQLCKKADAEALNPDNSIAMQSRMMWVCPETTARGVADEIEAWANESAPNDELKHRRE